MSHIITMSVSLPKELKNYIKQRTKQDHYGTPSDYIRGLIREDLKQYEQERLEAMLLQGLASGQGIPMDDAEWKKLHTEVQKQLKKRKRTR